MAASCTYNRNGKESKLYKEALGKYGFKTAEYLYLMHDNIAESFSLPVEGKELTLQQVEEIGAIDNIQDHDIAEVTSVMKQVNKLNNIFSKFGEGVKLEIDFTLDGSEIQKVGDQNVLRINPAKLKEDSAFHEFGHLYIDLLGSNHPLVQSGINLLKGTDLWNSVLVTYPELSKEQLAKEVLTTAIGARAAKLSKDSSLAGRIKLWAANFIRTIAEKLGIKVNAVNRLTDHLISGKLVSKFEGRLSTYIQRQKDLALINNKFMNKFEFVQKAKNAIGKKIKIFYDGLSTDDKFRNTNYQDLSTLKELLKDYLSQEQEESIVAFLMEALDQTSKLEQKLDKMLNPISDDDVVTPKDVQNILNYNATFDLINDLAKVLENDPELKSYIARRGYTGTIKQIRERYDSINNRAKQLGIKILSEKLSEGKITTTLTKRREALEREYNTLYAEERKEANKPFNTKEKQKFVARRKDWIEMKIQEELPELKEQEQSKIAYLLQQTVGDISYLDRMAVDADALNDELIQIASELLDKADYTVQRQAIDDYKDANELFNRFKEVKSEGNQTKKYDEMLEDDVLYVEGRLTKTGKKSKYLTSKYYSEFDRVYTEIRNELLESYETGDQAIIKAAKAKLENFLKENTTRRYSQEYYDALNSLPEDVEAEIEQWKKKKREILYKYRRATRGEFKNSYNPEKISEEDKEALRDIEYKLRSLESKFDEDGNRKEGFELRIAEELQAYKDRLREFYSGESDLDNTAFAAARTQARKEGREKEFMRENTRKVPTDEFWEIVDEATPEGKDPTLDKLDNLIKPYKLPDGKVNWEIIPDDRLKEIREIQSKMSNEKASGLDMDLWKKYITRINTDQYEEVKQRKKNEGEAAYKEWYDKNHYYHRKREEYVPIKIWTKIWPKTNQHLKSVAVAGWSNPTLKDEYINNEVPKTEEFVPSNKWLNPQWAALQRRNDAVKDTYDYFLKLIDEDDVDIPNWARLREDKYGTTFYKLPSVHKKGLERVLKDGLINTVRDRIKNVTKKEDSTEFGGDKPEELAKDVMVEVITDEQNNEVRGVPINYRRDISADDQSHDLFTVFLMNRFMVHNFREKNNIAATLELTREFIKERDVVKTAPSFLLGRKIKVDKYSNTDLVEGEPLSPVVQKGANSNAFKAYVSMIEDRLYGISSLDTAAVNKVTGFITSYTGNVLLIGNYLSSGANLLSGQSYNWLAKAGGVFYTGADLNKAIQLYTTDMPNMVGDIGNRVYRSKTNLLMERFDSLSDWHALSNKFVEDNKLKQLFKGSSLHVLNKSAEHFIQNIVMYSIMNNIKVRDANGRYLTKTGTTDDVTKAMSLHEAYSIGENNRLVLDPRVKQIDRFSIEGEEDIEFAVTRMIRDTNAYLQGQYSSKKRAEMQRHWWGQLMIMLRKWLPRGLKYRWRGGQNLLVPITQEVEDAFYSRSLGVRQEGYYVTTGRFLATVYSDLKAIKNELTMLNAVNKFSGVSSGVYKNLTDAERGNLIKTGVEAAYIVSLYAIGLMIKKLADDEDDKLLYLASFYAIRVQREMLTFVNPAEFVKTLKSPTAAIIMLERTLHLLGQLMFAPFETYKTGRRKGESKLWKDFQDLVPLVKNLDRDVEEAVSWMISRRI
jgi:hypothetical protein